MQQAITHYCDEHEELYPDSEKCLALFPMNIQRGFFYLMWHIQVLDWIRKKQEIKTNLKVDILKVIQSDSNLEQHLVDENAPHKEKLFDLNEVTKFSGSYKALENHPLMPLYRKVEKNVVDNAYSQYFKTAKMTHHLKKSAKKLDAKSSQKSRTNKELKGKQHKKSKKLDQKSHSKGKKHLLRIPSIQDLVNEKDKVMDIIRTNSNGNTMNTSQQAIFQSHILKKVQEENSLSKFTFTADRRFLVTAVLTSIDHFVSKPRDFERLNALDFRKAI